MYSKVKYLPLGDRALAMEFGDEISKEINAKIRSTIDSLKDLEGIVETVPTYRSINVVYDPIKISYSELVKKLEEFENESEDSREEFVNLVEIPTVYGGEYGPDMEFVCENAGLGEKEVVNIHTGTDYLVYMLGFAPGFTYLGGMDERIKTPRLKSPRLKIAAGSVGIAGTQTGMYPSESPGGWQLIGRTPLKLYDPESEPPVFIQAGDYIRYISISESEYEKIKEEVERGEYKVVIRRVEVSKLNG